MSRSLDFEKGFMAGSRQRVALQTRFSRSDHKAEIPLPTLDDMNARQRRALPVAAIVALAVGCFLVAKFFTVIVLSLLAAILFYPLYVRFNRRTGRPGTAASLTFLVLLLVIIIPLAIAISYTVAEVKHLTDQLSNVSSNLSLSEASTHLLNAINSVLGKLTHGAISISLDQIHAAIEKIGSALLTWLINFLTSTFSTATGFITDFILFTYVFTSMLVNADKLRGVIRSVNPLGEKASDVYLSRIARMTSGVVGGQFVIAVCQGVVEAGILWIAGIPYFFFFALILSFLSVIPLGGGILAIPIGIIQLLVGNTWQGLFILGGHFLIIVNIDNILRPRLIPKSIRINSALMMLAVFGGLGLFGFMGIAVGPIIMIIVLTTLQMYLPLADTHSKQAKTTTRSNKAQKTKTIQSSSASSAPPKQ